LQQELSGLLHWLIRIAVGLGIVGVLALGIGFFGFLRSLDRAEANTGEKADGIVVLTGGAQRIGDAVDLLVQGRGKRLLISGVNEKTSREQIAKLNPEGKRVFDCCVDLDYRARNTIGNAVETRRWAHQYGFRSLIVVTSNYHMPRTLVELASVMPEQGLVPHAVVTDQLNPDRWWYDPATARLLISEYVKYVVAVLRTRVEGDPEHSRLAELAGAR
jgi:uncharacterized SAM-binding protein YcdF (DUF218 family)